MSPLLWIDGLFAEFCGSFSGPLKEEARRLPFTLGLAPEPFVPWSHVFSHEITLAAPGMVAEAMPQLPEAVVREALFAHALAVIDAMGMDRIEDAQVEATPSLRKVLAAAKERRNALLARVAGGRDMILDPRTADRELLEATRQEREMLLGRRRVDFAMYEALSRRKQSAGMLASAALAARSGWSPSRAAALRRVLLGAAMGLQLYDDVIDWEEDAAAGRAWAVAIARGSAPIVVPRRGAGHDRQFGARGSPDVVHAAAVLPRMLDRARSHFRATAQARERARRAPAGALGRRAGGVPARAGGARDRQRRLREPRTRSWPPGRGPCSIHARDATEAARVGLRLPAHPRAGGAGAAPCDVVLATAARVPLDRAREAFAREAPLAQVDEALAIAPLFWLRVRGPAPLDAALVAEIGAGLGDVRHVTSAAQGSQAWAPPFPAMEGAATRATGWAVRSATPVEEPRDGGHWFLASEGEGSGRTAP